MNKLTEERIYNIAESHFGSFNPPDALVVAYTRAIEAALQPCSTCKGTGKLDDAEPGDIAFREIDCPECKKKEGREHDVPFPDMQEQFEAYYSQSFIDRDWRREAGVWAAAWKAATRYAEKQPVQEPVISRLLTDWKTGAKGASEVVLELFKHYPSNPSIGRPVQEPVSFYIYKETAPCLNIFNVAADALPWVYDQDPSSGFSARLKVYLAPPDQTAEIERLRNLSACEACAEIPSVMEYFKQCEERIATLEAALRDVLTTHNEEARATIAYENAQENFTNSVEESKRYVKSVTAAGEAEKKARKALGEE